MNHIVDELPIAQSAMRWPLFVDRLHELIKATAPSTGMAVQRQLIVDNLFRCFPFEIADRRKTFRKANRCGCTKTTGSLLEMGPSLHSNGTLL